MNIVITGATRGLGRALVAEFVAGGHTVFGCGTSGEAIFDLRLAHGPPHDFALVDVAQDVKVSIWATSVLAGHPAIVDADGILELETMPRSLVVVGAGVIGSEYASIFGELGVETAR